MIDRLLYRLGFVRRSVHNELRGAAMQLQVEWNAYAKSVYEWNAKDLTFQQELDAPKPPKFTLIKGGKS